MIRHTVLFKVKPEISRDTLVNIFTQIVELSSELPGILSITGGTCYFHENSFDKPFTHGFSIDFRDEASRDSFLTDEVTHPVKSLILDATQGGSKGVFGFDFGEWNDS